MRYRIDLALSSDSKWFDRIELEHVPRFGEVINRHNHIYQVDQIIWHVDSGKEVTAYVRDVTGTGGKRAPDHITSPWNTDMEAAKDQGMILLTATAHGKNYVITGGWDSAWSGQRWVFSDPRVPLNAEPVAWAPLPDPHKEG